MFKAFTDNISSFIGSATNKGDDKPPAEGDSHTKDDVKSSSIQGNEASAVSSAADDTAVVVDSTAQKSSKVPPPRPNPPLTPATSISKQDEPEKSDETPSVTSESPEGGEAAKKDRLDEKLDEVAGKAKEWGSYLYSMTKSAGASVGAKAMELKKVVADNTIIGDFVKEQDKFVSQKKEKARANEAAVPPWVGYNEEEQMKTQMLTLSSDKRNFLRNPPTGVQFHFDYETCYPVAMATLAEDERLQEMRFKLVPKLVSEHDFWRNYFYRVSLIKQSTQLTSLAKQSSSSSTDCAAPAPSSSSTEEAAQPTGKAAEAAAAPSADMTETAQEETDVTAGNDEFISDAYNLEISDEDLMREMEALRASPGAEDAEWEEELQKELTDFEVVGESGDIDDAALEQEIMNEMNKSVEDLK